LTDHGKIAAKMIVRKHRLWEVFLVDKLDFSWDEVHDIAEQLEHIKSEKLINKLMIFWVILPKIRKILSGCQWSNC
jgi:DtxR family Mn-dependent transcriptional regulator